MKGDDVEVVGGYLLQSLYFCSHLRLKLDMNDASLFLHTKASLITSNMYLIYKMDIVDNGHSKSWVIVAQEFPHMVHTLASKTRQLILFELDHNMTFWLHKWKKKW